MIELQIEPDEISELENIVKHTTGVLPSPTSLPSQIAETIHCPATQKSGNNIPRLQAP